MDASKLECSQMLEKHPILLEKEAYKQKYIDLLEYFVRKYSAEDVWANKSLALYKKHLLGSVQSSNSGEFDYKNTVKKVISTKFKPFKFFSYRYCVIIDCMFINALNNYKKGELIFGELSSIYHQRYQKKIRQVFDALYKQDAPLEDYEQIAYLADCWNKNAAFLNQQPVRIVVTATMSAGKSTLINAIVGKKINRTQNDACTAKIHFIKNKPFEDGYCYEQDYVLELDANYQTLMMDNASNNSSEIVVGTHFRVLNDTSKRIWLIDTPGVNSSQDKLHKHITEQYIKENTADMLIYLLNGENIGSEDDHNHLQFILDNYSGKIVFVVNKLDKFRSKEDSVPETLASVTSELIEMGFNSPLVVPISSAAAYLAKMCVFGESLAEDDLDEFNRMVRKLKKAEYQFNKYYPGGPESLTHFACNSESYELLEHSGILQLESIIYGLRG